jgi:outer membrane protein OmpA-like peptidoglycan-associated protein
MDDVAGPIAGSTTGGMTGNASDARSSPILVGSSTASELNSVRLPLVPVACWRVEDVRFGFDSSIVLPEVKAEVQLLAKLIADHTTRDLQTRQDHRPALSLFGHADPVNNDDYNKILSGRRSAAIYGMLTRRDEIWEDLFSNHGVFVQSAAGDQWGTRSIQIMLNELGKPVEIDGEPGPQTQSAIQSFQDENGLAADGKAGPTTRKKLFLAYMNQVCVDLDGNPLTLDKTEDFLAHGADAAGKGDFQGCGEFNPLLIFSTEKNAEFGKEKSKTARNEANAPNRRVTALLFRPGSRVLPDNWPCPRAKEGTAACHKRFFSDGEKRRSLRLAQKDRTFQDSQDTHACRFYDRISRNSPCHSILQNFDVRLYSPVGRSIPFAPCEVTLGTRKPTRLIADSRGIVTLRDVQVPEKCQIRWGFPAAAGQQPDFLFNLEVFLNADQSPNGDDSSNVEESSAGNGKSKSDNEQDDRKMLNNLGYNRPDPEDNVRSFQRDYGDLATPPLELTGILDAATTQLLRRVYKESADDLRDTPAQ